MAVPKKKRYKQVVKSRRSLQKLNLVEKKNLSITKFFNYTNVTSNYINTHYCSFCQNDKIKQYCLACLSIFHKFIWKLEQKERRHRLRDITQEYYANLAKRLKLAHLKWINQ